MDAGRAAFLTETAAKAKYKAEHCLLQPDRDQQGCGPRHAMWMLAEVQNNARIWKNDKLNRWLGYAQAILVMTGFLTLDEAKRCNKEA